MFLTDKEIDGVYLYPYADFIYTDEDEESKKEGVREVNVQIDGFDDTASRIFGIYLNTEEYDDCYFDIYANLKGKTNDDGSVKGECTQFEITMKNDTPRGYFTREITLGFLDKEEKKKLFDKIVGENKALKWMFRKDAE